MRAFIALELPDAFRDDVIGLARQLKELVDGRFMRPETYHLTLAFLGEVDDGQRAAAMDALDAACAGLEAPLLASDGLGKFGRSSDATLWLGVRRDEALEQLAERVRSQLQERGAPFDPKPFRPHITLARSARIPRGQLPSLAFPEPARAGAVTLFKSELSPEGAAYKPLYTVTLH